MKLNTRIAPSPTGNLHIGTARTAYFNWLASRSTGGKFILRIDDTDKNRSDDKYLKDIFDSMDFLNLNYDNVYYSSKRDDIYLKYIDILIKNNKIVKKDGAYVMNPDLSHMIPDNWNDGISGIIKTNDGDIKLCKDLILIKSDGSPTYHLASVIDDIDMNINCIIRGIDHLSNTIKHIMIYNLFDKDIPNFYHVGLIHGIDGKKLSKRNGAPSLMDYSDYNPDAILNFLLRMGWGPFLDNKDNSIIPRDKALKMFWTDGKMRSPSSKLDLNKLNWYNKKYKN